MENRRHVSFSEVTTFWRCPYKWYLRSVQRLVPTKYRSAPSFGSAFAELSRRYYAEWPRRPEIDAWGVVQEYGLDSELAYTLVGLWKEYDKWSRRNEHWDECLTEVPIELPLDDLGLVGWDFRCRLDTLARLGTTWHVRDTKTTKQVNTGRLDLDPQTVMAYPWAVYKALGIEVEVASTLFVRRQDPRTARTPVIIPDNSFGIQVATGPQAWSLWENQLVETVRAMEVLLKRKEADPAYHPLAVYNANQMGCVTDCQDFHSICQAEVHNRFGATAVIEEEYENANARTG